MGAAFSSVWGGEDQTLARASLLHERKLRYFTIAKHLYELDIGVISSGLKLHPNFVMSVEVHPSGEMMGCKDAHAFIVEKAREVDPDVESNNIVVEVCCHVPVATLH